MISAKKIILVVTVLFFTAIAGVILEFAFKNTGRYLVYFAIPSGAIILIIGGLGVLTGKVKNDLKE